jgi:MFS family permease
MKEQGMFRTESAPTPEFTKRLALDLGTVVPSLAGPKRPQDRVPLVQVKKAFAESLTAPTAKRGFALEGAALAGKLGKYVGFASMMIQVGAFASMMLAARVCQRIGRKPFFALALVAAMLSTAMVFRFLEKPSDIWWMLPIMGFCQLSLFAGYAIYLPELFPTRLRSTGTSFCYNVGRFIAAGGPFLLGQLTSGVFAGSPEPMRPAGLVMCSVFLLGLAVLPFAPETNGKPLPE